MSNSNTPELTAPLFEAIDLLTQQADDLRECHTLSTAPDDWTGEPEARAEYDRILRCVDELKKLRQGGEPVAVLRFERGTPGRENEMPRVVSCNWIPDGDYPVYAAPLASAPVVPLPSQTRWPVLRAMARNYTAGKHTWDALDAEACEQAAEEIRHLRAALACAPGQREEDATSRFMRDVSAELRRAREKFPGDRIMTIALAEEFGELAKAMLDESGAHVWKEAVQTAVMAARVAIDGDSSVDEWRAAKGLDNHRSGGAARAIRALKSIPAPQPTDHWQSHDRGLLSRVPQPAEVEVVLPPLPYPQMPGNDYTASDMRAHARAAVLADREYRAAQACDAVRPCTCQPDWSNALAFKEKNDA